MTNLTSPGVLVFCEQQENTVLPVGLELLGIGKTLASSLQKPLAAVLLGDSIKKAAQTVASHTPDAVYTWEHPLLKEYDPQSFAQVMEQVVEKLKPDILLIGATAMGRDFAARLAAKLDTGLTADCTGLQIDPASGLLLQTRPAFCDNVEATIICASKRPQMATVRPGVFSLSPAHKDGTYAPIHPLSHSTIPTEPIVQILSVVQQSVEDHSLTSANIVVACGRGVKNRDGVGLAQQLAHRLRGEIAASRGAVEADLLPRGRQIGQTGKTIRPKLYIACGISGAIQHLAGMHKAECIIAINADADAPIFEVADYAICGDIFAVLPALLSKL